VSDALAPVVTSSDWPTRARAPGAQRVRTPTQTPEPEKNEARFVFTKRASPSPGFAADVVAPQPQDGL